MEVVVWQTTLVTKFMNTTIFSRQPFLFSLLEHDMSWLFPLLLFATSVYIGITVTNFFYRGMSWEDMIMTDCRDRYGVHRGTVLEQYLVAIGIISIVVFCLLIACVSAIFIVPSAE